MKDYDNIEEELERAVALGRKSENYDELREEFSKLYFGGEHMVYAYSQANEILCKGFAIFVHCSGNPKESIIAAVNFGRDTDCLAAIAGGLAGAFSGTKLLPAAWARQVNAATKKDRYTNNRRTLEETADGLYRASRPIKRGN